MTKSELRIKYRSLRTALTDEQVAKLSLDISNRTLELPAWDKKVFHVFLPIVEKKEVDTEILLNVLLGRDKTVVVSKSDFISGQMKHYILEESTVIRKNAYGIPEPVDGTEVSPDFIDVVFVPLLAFDETGHRVGYGKGFYDRFLADCRADVVKIGLSFFEAAEVISDAETTDARLDFCVTPEKIYRFSPGLQ